MQGRDENAAGHDARAKQARFGAGRLERPPLILKQAFAHSFSEATEIGAVRRGRRNVSVALGIGSRLKSVHERRHSFLMLAVVVFGCATIIGLDGWRTLEARRDTIRADQEETANLARSLSQQTHDTFHLVEVILLGLRERAEVDGA